MAKKIAQGIPKEKPNKFPKKFSKSLQITESFNEEVIKGIAGETGGLISKIK